MKKMKKYVFFKYFIKYRVFAGGGWGRGRDTSLHWGRGWVFNFYLQYGLGAGADALKKRGWGQ